MTALIPALTPLTPSTPFNAPKVGRNTTPAQMTETAKKFESSMISSLLQPMFEGLSTDGPFGGGNAEGTFRSFLVDAIAKKVEKAGGLGLSSAIQREMIRMQQGGHHS